MGRPRTARCGTVSGRQSHLAHGEEVCEACRDAYNEYQREYQRRRREAVAAQTWRPRRVQPCGTVAGALRHWRNGEPACDECREAAREYQRARRAERRAERPVRTAPPVQVAPCGTAAAYKGHRRRGEPACEPCRKAWAEYCAERRRVAADEGRRPRGRPPTARCGTVGGYDAHRRCGEVPCADCVAAKTAAQREYRARKRAAAAGEVS